MAWSYKVRRFQADRKEQDPNLERLTLPTKESDNEPDKLAELPNALAEWLEPQSGEHGKPSLKYPLATASARCFYEAALGQLVPQD